MLHSPRKFKHKKHQKGAIPNKIVCNNRIPQFGTFAIKATEFGFFTSKQIDAGRKIIMKKIKKRGKLWVRVFPNVPVTRKPVETRMGKGKGSVDFWIFKVKPGMVLYEIEGVPLKLILDVFSIVSKKLPIFTKISVSSFSENSK